MNHMQWAQISESMSKPWSYIGHHDYMGHRLIAASNGRVEIWRDGIVVDWVWLSAGLFVTLREAMRLVRDEHAS